VKKLVLVLALVLTLALPVSSSTQDAWALAGNCPADGVLTDTELYVGDTIGRLHKIEQSDGTSCLVGLMMEGGVTVKCTDIAVSPITNKLHCIDSKPPTPGDPDTISECYEISRTDASATSKGTLLFGATKIHDLNSFEIDTFGNAYVAGELGKLYDLDVTNCALSKEVDLKTGVTDPVRASGDLIFNPVSNNDLFLASFDCDNCGTNCAGNTLVCNGLYNYNIPTKTLTFVADTGFLGVFAGDFVKTTKNICFLTEGTTLFQLDRTDGSFVNMVDTSVAAFGGAALDVLAGTLVLIDKTALLIAAMQSSTVWIAPVVLAGLGLVAVIIARKI